jgi:uncharacterized delta-60 repeat protein
MKKTINNIFSQKLPLAFIAVLTLIFVLPSSTVFAAPSDGTEDTAFYTSLGSGFNGDVRTTAIQADGKLLVSGDFTTFNGNTRNRLVRLNADGTEDTAFSANLGTGFDGYILATSIQTDGKIVVGGFFTSFNGNTRNGLVRLNANGTEDTAFYTNLGTGFNSAVFTTSIQTDGKIVVGGNFTNLNGTSRNYLVRLNSNGTIDTAFSTNLGAGFNAMIYTTSIQADGRIVVGGAFDQFNSTSRKYLVRLNSNGTIQTSFSSSLGSGFNGAILKTSIQTDGRILVGGMFTALNGTTRNGLVRLNTNGTIQTSFSSSLGSGFNNPVWAISTQPDGKILVGGQFTALNGITRNRFVRLNANGTVDTAFSTNLGTGFDGVIDIIFTTPIQADGKIVVGGQFTTLNGVTRSYLTRFTSISPVATPSSSNRVEI